MVILLRQLCIIIFFSIFFQNSASAETSENKKINQLEKRIAELETIVQLLLKKNRGTSFFYIKSSAKKSF